MATTEATGTGVSFELTGEQRALRELAHEFAEKEIRPKAAEYDEHQTHPAARSSVRSSAGAAPGSGRRSWPTSSARSRC
jgi:alkylation response protein AidB-like acyl-CoA dehydrogenase